MIIVYKKLVILFVQNHFGDMKKKKKIKDKKLNNTKKGNNDLQTSTNQISIYNIQKNLNDNNSENFQSEEIYSDLIKPGDKLILKNIIKKFPDGKKALNGISFNLYKKMKYLPY